MHIKYIRLRVDNEKISGNFIIFTNRVYLSLVFIIIATFCCCYCHLVVCGKTKKGHYKTSEQKTN